MNKEPVKKAKKGILSIVFSRISLLAVLLIIQIALIVGTVTYLEDYATYIYVIFIVLEVISVVYIINSKSNPAFKTSWILFILLIPIVGTVFYLFMKIQPGTSYLDHRLRTLNDATSPFMKQDKETVEALCVSKPANANLAHYLTHQAAFPVHRNTEVTYFPLGENKFKEMKKQLRLAEKYFSRVFYSGRRYHVE